MIMMMKLKNGNFTTINMYLKKKGCRYLNILLTRFLLVRKKIKYFIGYINDDYKIKPVCIMLS